MPTFIDTMLMPQIEEWNPGQRIADEEAVIPNDENLTIFCLVDERLVEDPEEDPDHKRKDVPAELTCYDGQPCTNHPKFKCNDCGALDGGPF